MADSPSIRKSNDNESIKLVYFGLSELPTLESRAAKIIEWIKANAAEVF